MLYDEAEYWMGTPHRMGGMDRNGIDCSGLVNRVFKRLFDKDLPRSTKTLVKSGKSIGKGDLQAGDLVFFEPEFKKRHVGIYMGRNRFLHASTTQGVIITSLDNPYWKDCYWKARRVLP